MQQVASNPSDDWPQGTVFVSCEFDQGVVGRHPSTGERIPPFIGMTITCPPGTEGYARAVVAWLANKYGWRIEHQREDDVYGNSTNPCL